jgi:uncharacterized protein (TIGR03790 family)
MKYLLFLFALAAGTLFAQAQTQGQSPSGKPLNERVMVVYNAAGDDSHNVAKYYMEKRNIPRENICRIDTDQDVMEDGSHFEPQIKKPIRACLEKIGKQQILYIVFAYQSPYAVSFDGHLQSIDQIVADIWDEYAGARAVGREMGDQPYFGHAESQGNVYEPFVPFAKYREQPGAKTIYCVWRMDGTNADVAKGLVDKALYAESHGLKGKTYFDIRGPIQDSVDNSYGAGEWDIYRASQMTKVAGFDVTLDDKPSEFGTAPSQLRCENTALYAGWYSLSYNDAFSWAPGAIGFHLDSLSAINPRRPPSWAAGALRTGITVTSGAVTEPFLEGLVHPDQIFYYLFQGANVGDAVVHATRWLKWMIINIGDPLYKPFPSGVSPYNSPTHQEDWFGISPQVIVGGGIVHAQFQMMEKRDKTLPVVFKSTYPELITLPVSAMIPPTATGAQFQIAVKSPGLPVSLNISVTVGTEMVSNTLNLIPILGDLTLSKPTVKNDGTVTGTVTIVIPAREPGITVKLSSSQPSAVVPDEVKIPVGARQATFPITGRGVKVEQSATITARIDESSRAAPLKITP